MSSDPEWSEPLKTLFNVRAECCDRCTGKRMAVQRLLDRLVFTFLKEGKIDLREPIRREARFFLRCAEKHPGLDNSREQVRIAGERDEYARILAKFKREIQR